MNLFKKIKETFNLGSDAENEIFKRIEVLNKECRMHARYSISLTGVMRLRLSSGIIGIIKDLSYNGLGVQYHLSEAAQSTPTVGVLEGAIDALDYSFPCTVLEVRRSRDPTGSDVLVGYAIHHNDAKTLVALRDIIEPLRCGYSMLALDPLIRHDRYRTPDWSCYRGDGPTDLLIRRDKGGQLLEALLTFRINEHYCELSYVNNSLKTGKMISTAKPSKLTSAEQMASTVTLDHVLLRYSICVLLGAKIHFQAQVEPLLWECLRHLKIEESLIKTA